MSDAVFITVLCRGCGHFYRLPGATTLEQLAVGCRCGSVTLTVSPLSAEKISAQGVRLTASHAIPRPHCKRSKERQ